MALLFQCDRCKVLAPPDMGRITEDLDAFLPRGWISIRIRRRTTFTLCGECADQLADWVPQGAATDTEPF